MKTYKGTINGYRIVKDGNEPVQKAKITCSDDIANYLRKIFPEDEIDVREQFYAVFLNNNNTTVGYYKVSEGGIIGTVVDMRLLFKAALDCLATSIILGHNHPSGTLSPSQQDKTITEKIVSGAKMLDMRILAHIILTKESFYSMSDSGDSCI